MYFTIDDTSNGGFRARAFGDNHEELMISQVYVAKQSAEHAISVLKTYASSAPVHDRTESTTRR